jgi:hypothetical protein
MFRIALVTALLVPTLALAAPARKASVRAIERAARKAAIVEIFGQAQKTAEGPVGTIGLVMSNVKLYVKASPTRPGIVNVLMRTRENGRLTDVALAGTWNSRTRRFSAPKALGEIKASMLRDAASLEKTVRYGKRISFL